ncbi:MAG: hypothetical protein EP329_07105 [Deltaproteobacteria bacterium]|nr:MAG: hypothetical protein EP329_07105 [Deltaproteobacteria bacterium]
MTATRALLLLLGLLAACGTAAPDRAPSSLEAPVLTRHEHAIADFQLAHDRGSGDLGWPCPELCRASDEACQTALELCTQSGLGRRCGEARQGCAWTRAMLPRACSYCAPPP